MKKERNVNKTKKVFLLYMTDGSVVQKTGTSMIDVASRMNDHDLSKIVHTSGPKKVYEWDGTKWI